MATPPLSLQEHGRKASSHWCTRCTWVPSYHHSRQEFLFVHPPQVCLAQGSDQPVTPAPAPATFPIAGWVNGQSKELQYTQKQSSATIRCLGAENQTRAAAYQSLSGFWHLTISKIHQEESLWSLQNICADTVVSSLMSVSGCWPGYNLGLARNKASAQHRQCCFPNPLPWRSSCHRGQHSKWEDHSTSSFANRIWGRSKARHPMHKEKSSL